MCETVGWEPKVMYLQSKVKADSIVDMFIHVKTDLEKAKNMPASNILLKLKSSIYRFSYSWTFHSIFAHQMYMMVKIVLCPKHQVNSLVGTIQRAS